MQNQCRQVALISGWFRSSYTLIHSHGDHHKLEGKTNGLRQEPFDPSANAINISFLYLKHYSVSYHSKIFEGKGAA